jgi:hypothetical protein
LARIPAPVWGIACLAALLHIAPVWRAQLQAPPGWRFSGNLHDSPDFIQYRAWMRQPAGLFLVNTFTTEPNRPHIPALFYSLLGEVARRVGAPPELVVEYAGCLCILALTVLLFATVRHFLRSAYQTWWVYLVILLGGGLGAHFLFLEALLKPVGGPARLFANPDAPAGWIFEEDRRGSYLIGTCFDTHFAVIWLMPPAAVVSFSWARRAPSPGSSAR